MKDPRIVLFEVNILFQREYTIPEDPLCMKLRVEEIPVLSSRCGNTCIVWEEILSLFS